jgi:hypothetical protein
MTGKPTAPTCCWRCARQVKYRRAKFDPRHLTLLPFAPAGCPPRSSPCSILPRNRRCLGVNCPPCAGFKAPKPGMEMPRPESMFHGRNSAEKD